MRLRHCPFPRRWTASKESRGAGQWLSTSLTFQGFDADGKAEAEAEAEAETETKEAFGEESDQKDAFSHLSHLFIFLFEGRYCRGNLFEDRIGCMELLLQCD
jgi:hypothetical protein